MNDSIRKKSPRAPSISLDDAIEKIGKMYDKERCHTAPIEALAQHLGYKSAANGAALSSLASLKYFGLLDRPKEGMGAVSKEYETFRFAPNEMIKKHAITKWLVSPPVFAELLDKYKEGLPSEATLKYDLIQMGFSPQAADSCAQVFRRSVDFAQYFELREQGGINAQTAGLIGTNETELTPPLSGSPATEIIAGQSVKTSDVEEPQPNSKSSLSSEVDRIPVRLGGGRRAWIEIPTPFYSADKNRLKSQIDLLITDDDNDAED